MMQRIIGIDPGSRCTGFGVIDSDGNRHVFVDCGFIKVAGDTFPQRLKVVFESVGELVLKHQPQVMAIEQVFVQKNADSALKLGQARGAAICAGVQQGVDISEYTPRQIKQAVVGSGAAIKQQVQQMVQIILQLNQTPQSDAADALAIAICHSHASHGLGQITRSHRRRSTRRKR